jgi:hypothetical protein
MSDVASRNGALILAVGPIAPAVRGTASPKLRGVSRFRETTTHLENYLEFSIIYVY